MPLMERVALSEFNVEDEKRLVGYCDDILSRSKEQLTINAPVVVITEAKLWATENWDEDCV